MKQYAETKRKKSDSQHQIGEQSEQSEQNNIIVLTSISRNANHLFDLFIQRVLTIHNDLFSATNNLNILPYYSLILNDTHESTGELTVC